MPEFNTAIDIANRACQHCGVPRIDTTLGFTEASSQASEIGFVYGKLRTAEQRRAFWKWAIRRAVVRPIDTTTMLLTPALWVETTTYFVGSIVADGSGTLWISRQPNNLGNDPQNTPAWEPYFGPLTVSLYDSTTTYAAGELVYTTAGDGTSKVFLSLMSGNDDNPATATAYDATVTYYKNQVVTYLSVAYMSRIDLNIGQTPTLSAADWAVGTTYGAGAAVTGSNGVRYTSIAGGNVGNDPVSDGSVHWTDTGILTPWTTSFVGGTGSLQWLQIGGSAFPNGVGVATLNIVYPVGAGPSSQSVSRNVYRLPASFLRMAPQDPKAGSYSVLGAPGNRAYDDWNFEGNYLVSAFGDPLALRFVADITDVTAMDPMFCEGLAFRIALAVCEPLTQSASKLATIAQEYKLFMSDARLVDAIEAGPVESPLDDFLACRA